MYYIITIIIALTITLIYLKTRKPHIKTIGKLKTKPDTKQIAHPARQYLIGPIPDWIIHDLKKSTGYDPVTGKYLTEKQDKRQLTVQKEIKRIESGEIHPIS